MRASAALLLAWSSLAFVEARHLLRRDVTMTEIVTQYSTVCPCTSYTFPSSSLTTSIAPPILTSGSSSAATTPSAATPSASSNTTTTTKASNAAATQSISTASLGDYRTTILTLHNTHRTNHTVSPLTWSNSMASIAQQIAASCVYQHDTAAGGGGYGQNIGAGFTAAQVGIMITNAMYDGELPHYPLPHGNDNPPLDNFGQWGHFSQIVWASTTQVGCYTQYCPGGLQNAGSGVPPYFTVCNYSPPGNYLGQFSNVHAPRGDPTIIIV